MLIFYVNHLNRARTEVPQRERERLVVQKRAQTEHELVEMAYPQPSQLKAMNVIR